MPGIVGGERSYSVSTTTAVATASRMNKRGYAFGSITNNTSVSRAITWYGAWSTTQTTPRPLVDQDAVAATQTVAANTIAEAHSALAGVPYACAVTAAAASTVALQFVWYR